MKLILHQSIAVSIVLVGLITNTRKQNETENSSKFDYANYHLCILELPRFSNFSVKWLKISV